MEVSYIGVFWPLNSSPWICLEKQDTLKCAMVSVWYWQIQNLQCLFDHFIIALQTSSANCRSSVNAFMISELQCYKALKSEPVLVLLDRENRTFS